MVLLNLAVKPGWVVVENLVQDRLGHAAFGLVTAFSALALIVAALSDFGLTPYSVKRVAAEPTFLAEMFPTVLPLRGLANVLALAAVLATGWVLGYRGSALGLLAAVATALLLTQYGLFLRGTLQARQRFNTDALMSVLEKLLLLLLVLGLLPIGLTLNNYIAARLVAAGFVTALLYGLMTHFFGRVRYRWQWPQARQALRASLPFAMMALLYGVNERIDMVMLERLHSPAEAGYYAGAYRWVDAVMMYAWTVLPLFFARFAAVPTDAGAQRELLWFGQRVLTLPLLFVVAFVLFRGEVLFWQFGRSTPAELAHMTACLKILFLNVLIHAFFAIYSTLLTSTAHEKPVSWAVAASIALNVALNLVFLPRYGAVAASWNTLACAVLVSGVYLVLVGRRTGVALPWGLLARLLLAFGLLCAAWFGVQRQLPGLPWWLEAGAMAAVFGGFVFVTGLIRPQELRQVLQRKQ